MLQSFKIVAPVPHVKHIQSLTHQMAVQATTALSIFALEITMMINQRYKARGFGFQLKEVQLLVQSLSEETSKYILAMWFMEDPRMATKPWSVTLAH
ncbi:uncharacterized protein LOC107027231 isoform X4 [Solanum pennellii]|uniref:Uncharacterized protein LOC107027231 isoform X4 n=1 Tax=Solanum pennellii TaxID=28526 RepID=A0ABM1HDG3_SOLPN|nr:uncharacterized protein LOC107027231 isoform X4 [Solanum pennellii]